MALKTSDKEYQQYLQEKFLPGRQLYLERLIYPRYLRELPTSGEIFDLGFGNSEFLTFCKKLAIPARGIDSNPHFVERARSHGLVADIDDITCLQTLCDSTVKAAISDNVLEHLCKDDLLKVFQVLERKLSPNGIFIAIVPGEKGFTKDPTHQTFVDELLINDLVSDSSLKLEKVFRWPLGAEWISKIFYLNMTVFKFKKIK